MAPGIEVVGDYIIRVTALDATTGNTVAGVNVSNVVITGDDLSGEGGGVTVEDVAPQWLNLPVSG